MIHKVNTTYSQDQRVPISPVPLAFDSFLLVDIQPSSGVKGKQTVLQGILDIEFSTIA